MLKTLKRIFSMKKILIWKNMSPQTLEERAENLKEKEKPSIKIYLHEIIQLEFKE